MFAFQYVEVNSNEICKEISFPSLLSKIVVSVFLLRFKANYLEKMLSYSHFSLWIIPGYISNLFVVRNNVKCLRGTNKPVVPHTKTTNFGLKSTTFIGAQVWSFLPEELRSMTILREFRNAVRELYICHVQFPMIHSYYLLFNYRLTHLLLMNYRDLPARVH